MAICNVSVVGSVPTRITHDAKQSVKMVDESFNWNESGMEVEW